MKLYRICLAVAAAVVSLSAHAITYTAQDSIRVTSLLQAARQKKLSRQQDCVRFFTRQFYGIPYVAKTLEVNPKEELVVNLRQLDCTTYVENIVALTLCAKNRKYSFADFCRYLQLIRYEKNVPLSYPVRLHYFTRWIDSNVEAGICKEINSPTPPFSAVQHVNVDYMTKHANLYPMLKDNKKNIAQIGKMEKKVSGHSYRYIPKRAISNTKLLRNTIHDGDIIVILTNKKGLDTQHLGFASWHKDGLHLINASMIHHKVVDEPKLLRKYLNERKSMTGIRIIRLLD